MSKIIKEMTKGILVLLVMLVLFLTGCNGGFGGWFGGGDEPTGAGLYVQFVPGVPPDRWYEGEPFELDISVRNTGNYDLDRNSNNYVYLSGYDKSIVSFDSDYKRIPSIEPATRLKSEGGLEYIKFYSGGAIIGSEDTFTTPIQAKFCYYYETQSNPNVCVDPTPDIRTAGSEVCQPHPTSGGNQGGPVIVTNVDQETSRAETLFTIHLQNIGTGRVVERSALSHCGSGILPQEYDKVWVDLDGGSGCEPNPVNIGPMGAAMTRCRFSAYSDTGHAYETQMHFRLQYGYEDIRTKYITFAKTS